MYVMAQIQAKKTKMQNAQKQQDIAANAQVQQQSLQQKGQIDQENIATKASATGQAESIVQVVKELGAQNRMLMEQLIKAQAAGQPVNSAGIGQQVQANTEQIQAILNPQQGQLPVQQPTDQQPDMSEPPPPDPSQIAA
jgi:hypothetical protein